jgi:hypothetical protein
VHLGSTDRLADGLRIVGIVFALGAIGLHELGCNELDRVAQLGEFPALVVRASMPISQAGS